MIRVLTLLVGVICVGCSLADPPSSDVTANSRSDDSSQPPLDVTLFAPEIVDFHGADRLQTLLYPDRVESFLVSKIGESGSPVVSQSGSDYEIASRGPDLSTKQIEHVRPLFTDMRGYEELQRIEHKKYFPNRHKVWSRGCGWTPGVVLRFYREDASVGVVLCFTCNEWAFEADGQRYQYANFSENTKTDGLQPALRSLMLELFPDNAAIKSISH